MALGDRKEDDKNIAPSPKRGIVSSRIIDTPFPQRGKLLIFIVPLGP